MKPRTLWEMIMDFFKWFWNNKGKIGQFAVLQIALSIFFTFGYWLLYHLVVGGLHLINASEVANLASNAGRDFFLNTTLSKVVDFFVDHIWGQLGIGSSTVVSTLVVFKDDIKASIVKIATDTVVGSLTACELSYDIKTLLQDWRTALKAAGDTTVEPEARGKALLKARKAIFADYFVDLREDLNWDFERLLVLCNPDDDLPLKLLPGCEETSREYYRKELCLLLEHIAATTDCRVAALERTIQVFMQRIKLTTRVNLNPPPLK